MKKNKMMSENEIGRVVAVDTAQVTIELHNDLKALTRSTYEGTFEVGRINSYVIIPVGSRRIVAMVTKVVMTEESELLADKTMVSLPSTRRLMKAIMIGSIDEGHFRQGVSLFPVLDSRVFMTKRTELDSIFGQACKLDEINPDNPGYCIDVGKSAIFPDYNIYINPDCFFGKHAAVIGSTGSGKSCSIAAIIQSIISRTDVKQTRIVILDTNGEYQAAFQKKTGAGTTESTIPGKRTLHIPTDAPSSGGLAIPYWFMNADDFVRLFRAAPGVQQPVLLNALSSARLPRSATEEWLEVRNVIIKEANRVIAYSSGSDKSDARSVRQLCDGIIRYLQSGSASTTSTYDKAYPNAKLGTVVDAFQKVQEVSREGIRDESGKFESYAVIDADKRKRIEALLRPIVGTVARTPDTAFQTDFSTADTPSYFSKCDFRYIHLDNAMRHDEQNTSRSREHCSTMLTRINRLLEDTRFEFLLGPTSEEWPQLKLSLATFLRDIMGLASADGACLSDEETMPKGSLPYYDRQRGRSEASNVVIVDLSLLASEVLENVTALIGRLIHEFLQRLSDPISGIERGEFPVVLVLEEAQNYIREKARVEEESISKQVYERIAREGRKYGLGLVVASQRPSELSKTVLSQCNSFIVHRLQNPEDLRYFREIVPGIYGQMLDQLPALAPRMALVLGECVQAPVLVEMREANPTPRSRNPQFYKSWTTECPQPDVERVCEEWEGKRARGDRTEPTTPEETTDPEWPFDQPF